MTLITITGETGSGKTIIARCLHDNLPGKKLFIEKSSSVNGIKLILTINKEIQWLIADGFELQENDISTLKKSVNRLKVVNISTI